MAGDSAPNLILLPAFSWITSGTYCHTLDSPEADAKVKSGARGVSQGSSPRAEEGMSRIEQTGLPNCESVPNKALVNLVITQGMSIAHSGWAAVAGPSVLLSISLTSGVRGSARDADPEGAAAGDCCQHC